MLIASGNILRDINCMVGDKTDEAPDQDGGERTPCRFMSNSNGMDMRTPPVEACIHTWGFQNSV